MKKSTKIGVVLSSIMGIGTAMAALAGFKLDRVPDDVDDTDDEKDNNEKSSDDNSSEEIDDEEIKEMMAEADSDNTDDKE